MASDFLEMAGFDVCFLGANVPTYSLLRMVGELRPDVVALSVTITYHLPALKGAITALREVNPTLPILVGGGAFTWGLPLEKELDVAFIGKDARELVAAACRLTGV
jgi:methanogenic corrinoid protein MtbC1